MIALWKITIQIVLFIYVVGKKRFFLNPSTPSYGEPSAKQPRNSEAACEITPEFSHKTSISPTKPKARKSLTVATPSPSKLSKRPCRVARSPRSPAYSSPKASPASPSVGECNRRRRGGELSKEIQVRKKIFTCVSFHRYFVLLFTGKHWREDYLTKYCIVLYRIGFYCAVLYN